MFPSWIVTLLPWQSVSLYKYLHSGRFNIHISSCINNLLLHYNKRIFWGWVRTDFYTHVTVSSCAFCHFKLKPRLKAIYLWKEGFLFEYSIHHHVRASTVGDTYPVTRKVGVGMGEEYWHWCGMDTYLWWPLPDVGQYFILFFYFFF